MDSSFQNRFFFAFIIICFWGCQKPEEKLFTCRDKYIVEDLVERFELARFGYDKLKGLKVPNSKLVSLEGESFDLYQICKGFEAVVIDFWFIGCAPCEVQMPYLIDLKNSYKNVKFISVAKNSEIELLEYLDNKPEFNWDLYLAHDITIDLCIDGYPTLFILDNENKIQNMYVGGSTQDSQAAEHIQQVASHIDQVLHN